MFFPEGEVETEAQVGPGVVDGYKLFGVSSCKVVGTDKEVESLCTEVKYGPYRAAHVGYRSVYGKMQGREGTEIDSRHTLGIGAVAYKAGGGEEAEGDGIVEYTILGSHS